jgi:hypothetical protein
MVKRKAKKKRGLTEIHDVTRGKNDYFVMYKGKKLYITKRKRRR